MRLWKLAKVAAAVVVGALGLLAASPAQASPLTGTVKFEAPYNWNYGGGGEFNFSVLTGLTAVTPASPGVWKTFCLEKNEFLNAPPAVYDAAVNTAAVNGGVGGGSPDPLSPLTAKLFDGFFTGALGSIGPDSYVYTPGTANEASAKALQNVIWGLENELGAWLPSGSQEAAFLAYATTAPWSGLKDIRVLNLTQKSADGTTLLKQDVLVKLREGFLVPVPAAAWMGLALLGGVGAVRAMRRRQA